MRTLVAVSLGLCCAGWIAVGGAEAGGISDVGLGLDLGVPFGDFGDAAGIGFGGTFSALYDLTGNLALTGRTGYIAFSGDNAEAFGTKITSDFNLIPIRAGGRFWITPADQEGARFFAGVEFGLDIFHESQKIQEAGQLDRSSKDTSSDFSMSPLGGARFDNFEVMGQLNFADNDFLGIRVSYHIPVGSNEE
jgi:hypothetical protein